MRNEEPKNDWKLLGHWAEQTRCSSQVVTVGYPELIHAVNPPSILYTWVNPAFTRIVLA